MQLQEIRNTVKVNYDRIAPYYCRDFANFIEEEDKGLYGIFENQLTEGATMLDLGCGPGRTYEYFSERGFNYYGVDFSPKMRNIAFDIHGDFPYILTDMVNIKNFFEKNSVDAVFSIYSLFHLPTPDLIKVVSDVYDILKPGGIFLLSYQQGFGSEFTDEPYLGDEGRKKLFMNYQTPEQMNYLLGLRYKKLFESERIEDVVGAINNGGAVTSYSIVKKRDPNFRRVA